MAIFSILFPIFSIVLLGYLYAKKHNPEMTAVNRINMEVCLPALIFSVMATRSFSFEGYNWLILGGFAIVLGSGLIAYPFAKFFHFPTKAFVPPMMFNNSGNIGLPLAVLAWGESALPAAVLLFMIENMLHFSLGTFLLNRQANFIDIIKVPVLQASILGIIFNLAQITIWQPLAIALKMLGDVSVPLLLFALGVRMTSIKLVDSKMAISAAFFRPVVGVLIAIIFCKIFPIPLAHQYYLIIFAVLPPAVLNFLFAEKYQQFPEKVAAIVFLGNLLAFISLPLALYYVLF